MSPQAPERPTNNDIRELLRKLPAVDTVLRRPEVIDLRRIYGRELLVKAIRKSLENARDNITKGQQSFADVGVIIEEVGILLEQTIAPTMVPVINATGVVVHTNLGRAPLAEQAIEAVKQVSKGYSNLEYDLEEGKRGSRRTHAEELVRGITTAEAALIVNNNAAAVLLVLSALCRGREVVISRGQLVEIGGGFRVPDIMAQSGAILKEVGTTNRTHLTDYEKAINENTAAILVAHHSNFKIVGFTSEPSLNELAPLAHRYDLPLLYDQGSGALLDTREFGLEQEMTVQMALAAGVDLICFSGDKLLGGPQAGIVVGNQEYVDAIAKHPLARAVRPDKMSLAALASTLSIYLKKKELQEIPVWQMISLPIEEIELRANQWLHEIQRVGFEATIMNGASTIGGGSLPGTVLPTKLVAIRAERIDELSTALRQGQPPVIGRIADDKLLLDPRTVRPEQDSLLIKALSASMNLLKGKYDS